MNKIYKVVWNATRGCYVVASELVKTHQGKKSVRRGGKNILSRTGAALLLAIAGWGAACNFIYADVTVADPAHDGKVNKTQLADGGIQYDIYNQQVNKGSALNKFTDFGIGQKDVANLQLDKVDRQINLVKNRIEIDGVVNAIKDNKIGGDVYFFSDAGIAVGANGVFNVGRLTLGTNAAYGEALYNGGMEKHLAQSAASQAKAVAGGSDITLQGKVYAQSDVVLGAGSVNVKGGEIRTHRNNADTYADKKAAEAYRNQLVNVSPSATVAKALGHGDIALAAVGASSVAKPFETKGAIVIDQAYMDAAGGDTSVIASAERNGGNLMGSKADASVEISNVTIQGQNVAISAETKVSGKVGSADAYKTGAEEDGILGLLHATFDEQVGSLASVVKTGADSRVTVKDSKLTAAEDLTISSKATSEIGSETGGALGVGINVGIADVSSKVEIQGTSALTAGKDLAISAKGSNAIDLQRQGSAEDLPIAIDLGWAEAKTDASVTVAKEATLKARENVDVSAKAERNLSVEVENSSGDGTLGLAVGVIQSETKATADVQGKVYADGKVSVSAENTVSDEDGKYDPDTLHITSESESDDGTSSDPIHDIVDVATTKGKGNQLMAGIKKLWGDQSTEKKAADAGTSAADQTASTSAGGGLGLNAATAFLFSDNSAKASLAGEVRGYDGASGAGAVDVHAETLSRTKVKAGVSQGADKSAGIAAAVNYIDQNDKAEAELSGDIKSKGNVDVSAETKRPWQSNLKGFGENLADDLKTIFDPNDGFELSYLTDSWTQTGGAGEKVSGAAALNIMEYNHTAKATVKKDTKVEIDNGDLEVKAKNDIHTVNFSGDIKAPIGDQPGSLDFWEDIGESPFSGGGKAALGGAALTVHQKNTAEATVEDGVTVTKAKDVSVTAENKGSNLSIAGTGGKGQTVAIDGTVNVNRFENTTKATVGKATINADGDVSVNAEDNSKTINIGGAIAVSGQAGIGATVAYNHIDRQTEASLQGKVTSKKDVSVTAKNTGAIYAMSAAGGITMESSSVNGAGSSGLHAQEGASGSGTSSIGDLAGTLLNAGKSGKDKKSIDSGDSALKNVASQDASMGENVGTAKGGFAAAANVSVNRITDTAKASVAKQDGGTAPSVTADALAIRSGNDSKITTGAGAIALGLSQNSQAIAGSFMYNAITDKNEAYAEDATLSLTGSEKDNTSLTVEADNAAKITNIAASGSGASKGSAVAGQISLNWVDNETDAHVKGGSLKADKATTISAKDQGTIDSYTGAVAVSGGGNGAAVGASIAANLIEGDTKAYLKNSEVAGTTEGEKAGKLSVTADETSEIRSIVAAGAGSGKLAAAFAASGNWIHTKTDAHISNANDMKTGALSVLAKNGSNATIGVGSAAAGGNSAGASIAVMVNQSEVNASLTGDKEKNHIITADGITIKADNAYNGKASDTDNGKASDTESETAKTVAVGFAGGTSQFAGSGSVTVNVIDQKTDATVGKGVYDAGKKAVEVAATSAAKLFGLAGGVSLSAGSGVGAAVDVQTYKGHTYAGIADGASLKNASSVTVNADSKEHLTSVAATLAGGAGSFAGAGAAGAHSVSTDTKAYVGQSEVTEAGDVSVTAKDETELNTLAGSGAASGNTGVGLTAAVEVVNKKASAIVGDNAKVTGRSLTVKAENTSSSETDAYGLGAAATAGLAGAASETFVNQETDAHVGKTAKVNVEEGAEILANSTFTQGAAAGSAGVGGTVGIGISNATVSLHAVTKAYADDDAVISGGNQVKISADHATNLTYATVAGGVGGTVGVSGNAAVNIIDTETKAYTGKKSALSADEAGDGISIIASDTTELHGGNGGAAIGISGGGAGVAVGVTNLKKNTSAYADQNAKLDSKGQVAVSAKNKEDIDNVTVQVAGGTYAGLAGAVNVMNLSASTKAYTDTGVQINQANKAGGDISVKADHALKMTSAVGGAAASGGASGGAAVDVANIKTQTNAYIGDSNTIDTKGDVSVSAKDEVTLNSHAYAASIGAVGLSGSISVYSIGSASFDDKDNILSGKNAKGQDEDLTTWVNGQVNQSQTGDAMKAYDGKTGALSDVNKELGTTYKSQEPTTEEKGTLAKIGKGTTITADGNVSVDAADTLNMQNYMSSITGSAFASAGASVSVVNTDTQTKALIDSDAKIAAGKDLAVKSKAAHRMDQIITGASVSGGVSGQGTVATWNDRSDVSALIGASRGIGANNVTVTSDNDRTLEAKVAGASVALGAVNGSVIVANTSGSSTAGVGDESKENTAGEGVTAKEAITISANADTNLDATAIGAAAGVFAGDGTGVRLSSDTDAKAFVGKKEKLKAGRDLSVTAKNTPKISALSTSAAVGLAGVGITVAMASSDDSAHVSVGDGAALTAGEALTIKASMDKPASGSNMEAHAIAGGGGVVSGAVADVRVNLNQHTDVSIGENAALKGKTADISAVHQSASALAMESVAAGYYSGTGGETRFSETSDVSVSVGDDTTIETEDETRILAENQTEKAQTATSGGAALATGAGIVNETTIRHTTAVDLGKVAIHANASALTEAEKAAGKTLFDKNAIAIDAASHVTSKDQDVIATGSAVGAAHVKNAHHVTAETTTSVAKGASLLAGDTEEIKKEHKNEDLTNTEDKTYGKTYRGGSIGVGSKNDADLTGTTMVDVFGAAGYAGTSNEVTYDGKTKTAFGGEAETAKGDIRVASGRDSAGTIGQLNVKAKSDILNATAIPISSKKDPFAKISSDAALSMNGTLLADRDIYLQSTAGESKATGSGEVKDWVNKVGEVFGTEGGSIGKSEVTTKATAALDGKAETGIHRNKSITIGGTDNGGTWNTSVTTKGDIDFTLSKPKPASETLSKRLAELKKELADHISDPAAKASYEAEIAFVESKMVEQGLGYRAADGTFIEIDPGTQTEYDETKTMLDGMTASKDAVLEAIQKDQVAAKEKQDKMTAMQTTYQAYQKAQTGVETATNFKNAAEREYTDAETALKAKIGNNPTQEEIYAYVNDTANKDIQEVKDYQTTKAAYDKAAGVLTKAQEEEAKAKATYETAVTTAGYDSKAMDKNQIQKDWDALGALQTAYAKSDKTIKEDIDNLTKQVKATEDFKAQGGTERDGKFYCADGSEVEGGKWNGETLLHIIAYPHMTRDVTIEDTVSQLGDIYLEGDAITGSGTLTANGDAKVEVKNASPNNLILGDIKVMGKESNEQIGQGGAFYLNGNAMKGTEQLGNLTLKGRRQTEDPSVTISNTFDPNTYTKDVGEGEKAPVYTAPNLTLGKGKTIYNTRGKVTVVSDYGDVYNDGSIVAGSVELTAKNGDFIQSYSNRIANIGGDPFVEDKEKGGFKKNEALGSGILANGNIFISARYVNINAKIQSGIANWALDIPETPIFGYKGTDGKLIPITAEKAKTIGKDHTIYVANATGNMAENLTYDAETGHLVLGQTEVHGGKVSIVGTIINTTKDTKKACIEALDGYGSMTIDNKSKLDLELKGLSTGEGVEGVIEITDLDPTKGTPSRKTTYTRKDGSVHMLVQQYQNGSWTSGTEKTFDGTYNPSADQHYVFQTGTDKSTTNTYEYHGDKFDWWGIENKTPTRDELIAMGAKLTNTVTGEEKALVNGTFISGKTDIIVDGKSHSIGDGQTKEWDVLNKSDVIDYSIKTKRRWYTIGLTKKYDMKMVIRDYETHIKQYETGASHAIGIGFGGNENGGNIKINQNGGAGNVSIAGTISNVGGTTAIKGDSITSTSKGFLQTKALDLKATNDVGSKDQAILTSAEEVFGIAKNGNFYLNSSASDVAVGAIEAAKTVSLTSEGSLTQKADAMVKGSRVELTAETGAITGKNGDDFNIQTKHGSGEAYGLKASADGDIVITNKDGDLYLDSVTSKHGDVTLTTEGSFIDNNFGDVTDGSAKEKLLAWANAAVLEGSDATVEKQKTLLKAKVESKYNEYQSLAAYVKDGKYTLDETARAALEKNGVTDIDKYIADKQARYDALKDSVGTWTKEGVDAYSESIDNSKEAIYGKASLKKDSLTDDTYLTKDEKASILVGSAKSAQDLLVTFSPGGIKEGISDTQATLKETPHVSGQNVKLTALGGKTGEKASGIGHKENGQEIDLSAGNLNNLTAQELLALAAAERGDFKVNRETKTVTVSSIRSIEANAGGILTAKADNGAIYLQSAGAVNTGSSLTAAGEVRLKAKGDVNGVTIGSSEQTVIESGAGKISDVTVTGTGVLTARAKDGVSLKKSDGDLVINTVYAAEGDVHLDLGKNSLLAEDGHDKSGDETGTTYTNVEGKNITITNAKNIKGASNGASLGMKVTGTKAKDGSETPGVITAHATGDADITLFGEAASDAIDIEAEDLTITSRGNISNGNYQAGNALRVHTAQNHTISGGNFSGGTADITNAGKMSGGTYTAKETMGITNQGTIENGKYTAHGDLTYTDTAGASLKDGTLISKEGKATITAHGVLQIKKLSAKDSATVEADHDVTLNKAEAGMLTVSSDGSVNAGTLTATTGDAKVKAKTNVTIGTLTAEVGGATIEATDGALDVTTLNAKSLTAKAGTTLSAKTLDVKEHAELTSGGAMMLESASADTLTANAGTTLDATKIHVAGDASLVSGSDMLLHEAEAGGKLTTSAGGSISVKGTDAKISGSTIEMTAKEDIRITDRSSVGKLHGVDTSTPAGSTTGSGAAGSLVIGEAKPHDFDASGKGSALLSSAGGKVTLSAKKVEIDTLANGEGNAAELKISADNIGIDDLAGVGAQHVTIHGKDGQSQAHYAGIHSTAEGGTLVKDSAVEHLELTGREPLGLSNTAIGGDSVLATDKIRVTIEKNPGSSQAEHFGNLSLGGYDIATDHVMTSVKDGLTVNGERFPVTAESVMNASLYEDRTLGRDGREKEEETEKESPSLAFGAPNDKEAYEVVK